MVTLYHGTSSYRHNQMLSDQKIQIAKSGDPKISLTPNYKVALYWARMSTEMDIEEHPDKTVDPCILEFHMDDLLSKGYFLTHFDDQIYGEGECSWEQEIAVWSNISVSEIQKVLEVV